MRNTEINRNRRRTVNSRGMVMVEPLPNLERYRHGSESTLKWECVFMLPAWLSVWWTHFGRRTETSLFVVKHGEEIYGIAPLVLNGETARLVSDSDLIDYSDFITAPSKNKAFFEILFSHLRQEGITRVDIPRVRSDSSAVSCLNTYSSALACHVSCSPVDMLYEMALPDTWEAYLGLLTGTERHEIRRKIRRLEGAGNVGLRVIENLKDVSHEMDTFIKLFRSNRPEKAEFMSSAVESFFRTLAREMAEAGLLKLFLLDLNGMPVAAVMCFDYDSTFYLYNNGYDRQFTHLSVGLLSKVFSVQEGIKRGRKKYNFLRGSEEYKGRLGGRPVRLLHCEVNLR